MLAYDAGGWTETIRATSSLDPGLSQAAEKKITLHGKY
jgi:hypothetical protein